MTEKPILFSGPMVRAILEGRKTQTRRVKKGDKCPYGADRLWVRETFQGTAKPLAYRADGESKSPVCPWKPSIHMPRWASRINLRVKGMHVEHLWEIEPYDCLREGIEPPASHERDKDIIVLGKFQELWDSINDKRGFGWEKNPLLWVVEFEVEK